MKKISIVLLFIVGLLTSAQAQKETYNWVFGNRAGLTWSTTTELELTGSAGTPNAVLKGLPTTFSSSISTVEGCFSLSDSGGNLLFYSDGTRIWNKNHQPMPNGTSLTGNRSSAQSGIILPYPGNQGKYIAVTLGARQANNLSYSVVDMAANGGLGDIMSDKTNILFTGVKGITGESVTSILHANEKDYWIIAPGKGTPSYLNVWLVTSAGIAATPTTTVQLPFNVLADSSNGYFKLTADGKHFVWTTFTENVVFFGDFNSSTGVFSNIKRLTGYDYPYGVEFTSSLKYVYIKDADFLYVYNFADLLAAGTPSSIVPVKYVLSGTKEGALQMGPDGRIYVAASSRYFICVIDNPEEYNNLKIYELPLVTMSHIGLPSFAASWFNAKAVDKSFVCTANSYTFVLNDVLTSGANPPTQLRWNFGDGTTIVNQNIISGTTTYKQPHTYATTGKYTITVTPYRADNSALSSIIIPANIVDCSFRTNRMIRTDLLNTAQQQP